MDENKNYIKHYPGFLKPDDNGKCIPCCFKSWNEPAQTKRRKTCTRDETIIVPPGRHDKKLEKQKKNEYIEIDEYILAPDKFPISYTVKDNRYGFLPLAVQKFLHTDNKKCQISSLNTNIKPNHQCLLRHSIDFSPNQSFIACIADVWFESYKKILKQKVRPTVSEMKQKIINELTVDKFVTLQNGNLMKKFYPNATNELVDMTDLTKYSNVFSSNKTKSIIYEKADKSNPEQINALIKLARSYSNFIEFLKDDTVNIDYEYLWDFICNPNDTIFHKGVNLVIIELVRKDITDSVELICTSNHYSSTFFNTKKDTLLILKIDNFYEPIYGYETNNKDEILIEPYFNSMSNDILPNIKHVFETIKTVFKKKCTPLPSMSTIYKFVDNISLEKVIYHLQYSNCILESQVMNYDSKIIGVVAINNIDNTKGFIPCYPSAVILTYPVIYINESPTDNYENTKKFLKNVYKQSKKKILCKPSMKIIEDDKIVGIITMTNQFVMVNPTEYNKEDEDNDDLKVMNDLKYTDIDTTISTNNKVDTERVNYIKKMQLETKFYNVFRNTARYLLNKYENRDIRLEIDEKNKSSQVYLKKLKSIETKLREVMKDYISFYRYDENDLLNINTITNCYNNCKKKVYCHVNEDSNCLLRIPETNLINDKSNDTIYYGKLADELIRYSRIKTFMLNPKAVLSFSQVKYNLKEDEIILLHSLLTQDYFTNIIPMPTNKYVNYNTYDSANPLITQKYSNVESFDKTNDLNDNAVECTFTIKEYISNKELKNYFPVNTKEYEYKANTMSCSFNAILKIIQTNDLTQNNLTINAIKETLLEEYVKLYARYRYIIREIWRAQGKKILAGQIKENQITLPQMIMSEDYYATNIDVWILAVHYKIPLIFISDNRLMENNRNILVANIPEQYGNENEFYFIKSSSIIKNIPQTYTIMVADDKMKINIEIIKLDSLKSEIQNNIGNLLIPFIENFSLTDANKRRVKMNVISKVPVSAPVPVTEPVPVPVTEPVPVPVTEPVQPIKKLKKKIKII